MTTLPSRLFVTGTSTGVGKTVVSSILTAGLHANYWKPVQSGLEKYPRPATDSLWVKKHLQLDARRIIPEKYLFETPVSPHLAARIEGRQIVLSEIVSSFKNIDANQALVVEGAGGALVPLNDKHLLVDLMVALQLPVVVVTHSNLLGTINHTLMTVEVLRARGLRILGIILNGKVNLFNLEAIEKYSQVPVIAQIDRLENFDRDSLIGCYTRSFDMGYQEKTVEINLSTLGVRI